MKNSESVRRPFSYWLWFILGCDMNYLIGPKVWLWGRGISKNTFTRVYDQNFKLLWSVDHLIILNGDVTEAYIEYTERKPGKFAFQITLKNKLSRSKKVWFVDVNNKRVSEVVETYTEFGDNDYATVYGVHSGDKAK